MYQLKYPMWQGLLRDAILEFDPQKLPQKVQQTEAVIRARYQALCSEGSLTEERQALVDALATMRVLTGTH